LSTKLPEQQTVRAVVRDRATGLISQVVDAAV
jgi:hypothetical protein